MIEIENFNQNQIIYGIFFYKKKMAYIIDLHHYQLFDLNKKYNKNIKKCSVIFLILNSVLILSLKKI